MTPSTHRPDPDLVCAIGLAWGLLSSQRIEDAASLVQACELLWPDADETHALAAVCGSLAGPAAIEPAAEKRLAARWSRLVATIRARVRLWPASPRTPEESAA